MSKYRDTYCGKIDESYIGKEVTTAGWIANIRDHGGVIFLDLRDENGIIQLVSNDDKMFEGITKESSVTVKGTIRKRDEDDYNDHIATGTIELLVSSIEVLGKAPNELPFEVITSTNVSEEVRLKYRYLDLRNDKVRNNINLRAKVLKYLRDKMDGLGFTEVQTPIITASSPEGARDFIIPSRKFHKYYQIAPCFRDEDSRSDRTLEFYQLDFEMAFVEEEDVYKIGEEIFYDTFTKFSNKEVSKAPFRRIPYRESMLKYGTDKPDLRNPLEIIDISEVFTDSDFKPFRGAVVRGIKVDDIGDKSNSWFNELVDYASSIGMPGIGYITLLSDGTFKGPIDKFLTDEDRTNLIEKTSLKENGVLFFIADKKEKKAAKNAGMIRDELGRKLDLIDPNKFEFCIINDIPMYEYDEEEDKYDFAHNPFSMPHGGIKAFDTDNVEDILAYQFDFVCNGNEMSSGAVRNYDLDSLEKAFKVVGYDKSVLETRFKSLYNAFQYGVPPHAGMAPGIDRIIMLLQDEPNLREVQAFPANTSGQDLMMGSPSEVSEQQLREVHIKIR